MDNFKMRLAKLREEHEALITRRNYKAGTGRRYRLVQRVAYLSVWNNPKRMED